MISRREQLIRAVHAACSAALAPTAVVRQPVLALTRAQAPALVLSVMSDAPIRTSNERTERELLLRLTAYARDLRDGFAVADDLLCRAHAALFAQRGFFGLALSIQEHEVDYQSEDADVDAVAIPAVYRITYRTLSSDIAQGG